MYALSMSVRISWLRNPLKIRRCVCIYGPGTVLDGMDCKEAILLLLLLLVLLSLSVSSPNPPHPPLSHIKYAQHTHSHTMKGESQINKQTNKIKTKQTKRQTNKSGQHEITMSLIQFFYTLIYPRNTSH